MSTTTIDQTPLRAPEHLRDMKEPERLIIWSYRRWVLGLQTHEESYWERVWRELSCVLGEDRTRTVLSGLQKIIASIGHHARRPVRLHPPCCGYICADELSVVFLIAACQRRDYSVARRVAEWLVSDRGVSDLLEGAGRISSSFREAGQHFPDRTPGYTVIHQAPITPGKDETGIEKPEQLPPASANTARSY